MHSDTELVANFSADVTTMMVSSTGLVVDDITSISQELKGPSPQKSAVRISSSKVKDETVYELKNELILKEKTPWEQDLELQTERILAILEKAILKLEMISILPKWLENDGEIINKYLHPEDAKFVLKVCQKYLNIGPKEQGKDSANMYDQLILPYLKDKKDKLDPQMTYAMDMLWTCQPLRKEASKWKGEVDEQTASFIGYMKTLKEAIKVKLNVSSEEERLREFELKRAFNDNIICRAEIKNLEEQLAKQHVELGSQLQSKEELIQQYKDKIENLQNKFQESIKQRVAESEKQMVVETIGSETRQIELAVEAREIAQKYDILLEQHLADERALRARKSKVELQLATWLAKYDQDIGERNAEFEQIQVEYDEEKAAMDALQERYDEQYVEYRILMREKEEEEKQILEIKIFAILKSRSARRIQRAWRAYKERKELRKLRRKAAKKRAAARVQKKLEGALEAIKKKKSGTAVTEEKKAGKKAKKKEATGEEEEPEEAIEGEPESLLKVEDEEGEGEEAPSDKKNKKKEKKKGKKQKKGEKPKKKELHLTKEGDAIDLLEKAFGGELTDIDTTTQFNKDAVKVDLSARAENE